MFAIGVPELLIAFVLGVVVLLAVAYWIIRLAVRHGTADAQRRQPRPDDVRLPPSSSDAV